MTSELPSDVAAITQFLRLAGRLKRVRRQGWLDRGVDAPESVADHSWRLALLTLVIGSRNGEIDLERAVVIALVHDLPEVLAGDTTPFDTLLKDDTVDRVRLFHQAPEYSEDADRAKTDAERRAMTELVSDLPHDMATMFRVAWEEYEAGQSAESKLVRQLDKLETYLQALEYREDQPELIIESFRLGTLRDVRSPELVTLLDAITRLFQDHRDQT